MKIRFPTVYAKESVPFSMFGTVVEITNNKQIIVNLFLSVWPIHNRNHYISGKNWVIFSTISCLAECFLVFDIRLIYSY